MCLSAVAGLLLAAAATDAATCEPDAIGAAEAAVRDVFGDTAMVTLGAPACAMAPSQERVDAAVAEPGSRTEGFVRFVLYTGQGDTRRRAGRLSAEVSVSAAQVRVLAPLPAGATLSSGDVEVVHGPVGRVPFAPLPGLSEVGGARLRRSLPAGGLVTSATVQMPALVQSGESVVTVARVDGVEVRGRAIAAQSGSRGDLVLVVNPESRKRLRGRVVDAAVVEVLHES